MTVVIRGPWAVESVPVDDADTAPLLRRYFAEMVGRYVGREATCDEVDAALAEDPSTALTRPTGQFLLARYGGDPAGCAGVKLLQVGVAEMKRVFIRPDLRGLGGGAVVLSAVEYWAGRLGAGILRLDTRSDLVEARGLYAKHGYVEIPAYNDGPYAEHWFEKTLVGV